MSESYMLRFGKLVPTDEVRDAWVSGDLDRMLRAVGLQTNFIDRHSLLLGIVKETYGRRSEPAIASECARFAEMHLAEFETIAPALKADMEGTLPRVPTFQHYATLLTEQGDFERAIWACELGSPASRRVVDVAHALDSTSTWSRKAQSVRLDCGCQTVLRRDSLSTAPPFPGHDAPRGGSWRRDYSQDLFLGIPPS